MANLSDSRQPRHLPAIGALRGLAALYVVAFHMTWVPSKHPAIGVWVRPIIDAGFTGVPLFFVVSAFTLCHSMNTHNPACAERRFYIRRLFRILPLFYFILGVSLLFRAVTGRPMPGDTEVLLSIFVLFNVVPGMEQGIVYASWSIGVEMLFYAMFPPIFRCVRSVPRSILFLLASLTVSVTFEWLVGFIPASDGVKRMFFRFSLANSLPCFAIGMLVYQLYDKGILSEGSQRFPWLGPALVAAGGVLLAGLAYAHVSAFPPHAAVHGMVVCGLLLRPVKAMVNRVTEFFGDISYSIYLWHTLVILSISWFYPAFYMRFPTTLAWGGSYVVTVAVVTVLAIVTFRLIEEPGRKLGAHLIQRDAKRWREGDSICP